MGQDDEDFKIKAHTTNFVEFPVENSYCLFACQSVHLWCRLVMDRKKKIKCLVNCNCHKTNERTES